MAIYLLRTAEFPAWGSRPYWIAFDQNGHMCKGRTRRSTLEKWIDRYGKPDVVRRITGLLRPAEAVAEISARQLNREVSE